MSLKFLMGPSLHDHLKEWLCRVDFCQSYDVIVYDLVKQVEEWLPPEQTYCGSQLSPEVENEIDGYNKALLEIKAKLRNSAQGHGYHSDG